MTDTKVDGRVYFNKPVRALYCNVTEARKFKKNGKEVGDAKFDATFEFDAETLKPLMAKAIEVAKAKWPGRDLKELKFPFKKAEDQIARTLRKTPDKDVSMFTPNTFIMAARSKYVPALSYRDGKKVVDFTEANKALAKQKFYNGCYVLAAVTFVPYTGDEDDGVNAYLDIVMWDKDGPKIATKGASASEAFKGYLGTVSSEDPTGGAESSQLEDEISF